MKVIETAKPKSFSKDRNQNNTKEFIELTSDEENNKQEEKHYKFKRLFEVNRISKEGRREKPAPVAKNDNDSDVEFIGAFYPSYSQKQQTIMRKFDKARPPLQPFQPLNVPVQPMQRVHQKQDYQGRKIQKVSDLEERVIQIPNEKQEDRQNFDLDLVMRYTNKRLFIELIRLNNENTYENCE